MGTLPRGMTPARDATHRRTTGAIGALLVIVALVLRIQGARGTLWLDEIWSLDTIEMVRNGSQDIWWSLALDNNHYFNTLYLYLAGSDAPVLVQRGFSIFLGCAAVIAAAWAVARFGTAARLVAMALFAIGFPLVNYGSEARGYAGLILMTLVCLGLTERVVNGAGLKTRLWLGVAAVLGLLFQPVMAASMALFALWCAATVWRETRSLRTAEKTALRGFLPAAILYAIVVAFLSFAISRAGGYAIGGSEPFSASNFAAGYGGLIKLLLGLPDGAPGWIGLIAALLLVGIGAAIPAIRGDQRAPLYVLALVVLPLVVFALRPPNVQFPRYYLPSGVVLLLYLAHLFAFAWRSGTPARALALAAFLGIGLGNTAALQHFYASGRGDPRAMLDRIAESPQPVVATGVRDRWVIDYLIGRYRIPVTTVAWDTFCNTGPRWMLTSNSELPDTLRVDRADCKATLHRESITPYWGISGAAWALYRVE
jgi:hypothetical protein